MPHFEQSEKSEYILMVCEISSFGRYDNILREQYNRTKRLPVARAEAHDEPFRFNHAPSGEDGDIVAADAANAPSQRSGEMPKARSEA